MRKDFTHFDDLISFVKIDKETSGSTAGTANRFPVRFVLFDNFQDSYRFVSYIQEQGCRFKSVNDWLDNDYLDTMLTYSELSDRILKFASSCNDDCIITPFSELARFYNNSTAAKEFDALVKTIKGVENNPEAFETKRRIYIPIVGLEGKMSLFENDSQSTIWYLKNNDRNLSYNLILTNNTDYGAKDLSQYNVANNVNGWLDVWKAQPAVKPLIICTSKSIYANAEYAQPDNAFNFIICRSAYDFLAKGLKLDFGEIVYKEADEIHWKRLASEITELNPDSFSFEKFFNSYFHIDNLADYNVFLKTWFECKDEFEKWLLCTYYNEKFCQNGYICRVINKIQRYSNNEFFAAIALAIFTLDDSSKYLHERMVCMQSAKKHKILLTQEVEYILRGELLRLAASSDFTTAVRYFSPLSKMEKILAIEWFSKGYIQKDSLKQFFPDLYYYLEKEYYAEQIWLNTYFDEYKKAKLLNKYTSFVSNCIKEKNASSLSFNAWYQELKTTKTILSGRTDIDVYYWIDGLGCDWISFIKNHIEQQQSESIFLNEIYLARAIYPTTTNNNKNALLELSSNNLIKCGDLDSHAHQNTNEFPTYILEEIEIVNKAIDKITSEYNGKKIAIVSDHGLTALSQLCDGMSLAGVKSDHHGRLAIRTIGKCVSTNEYIVCDDEKTICALHHKSLCGKVPNGQSAHGGCTPEEVLVPIFVLSSKKEASLWKATLETKRLTGSNPTLKYIIKGISLKDSPFVIYNGKHYALTHLDAEEYQSEKLDLINTAKIVTLVIADKQQIDGIEVLLGAEEDDLFDF